MSEPFPQEGDEWEIKFPGKSRRVKTVGSVVQVHGKKADGTEGLYDYVNWQRQAKGRYSGLSVYLLLKHGRRLSTKAEREERWAAIAERRKQEKAGGL